jgi:protein-arginine kinase activator protein McsA
MICSHCKQDLPEDQFYVTTNYWHEKRGRTYVCKTCSRESARLSAKKKRKEVKDEVVTST